MAGLAQRCHAVSALLLLGLAGPFPSEAGGAPRDRSCHQDAHQGGGCSVSLLQLATRTQLQAADNGTTVDNSSSGLQAADNGTTGDDGSGHGAFVNDDVFWQMNGVDTTVLKEAFKGNSSDSVWGLSGEAKKEVTDKDEDGDADVYGEILAKGTQSALEKVGAKPGEHYFDLGSGAGKTVAVAWLMGLKATGIELSKVRFDVACAAAAKLSSQAKDHKIPGASDQLSYAHGSFLDIDFSAADVVFADSVMWDEPLMLQIGEAARAMKKGARVISAKRFPGDYKDLGEMQLPCSWAPTSFYLQEKTSEANQTQPHKTQLASLPKDAQCTL